MKYLIYGALLISAIALSSLSYSGPGDYKGLWIDLFDQSKAISLQGGKWFFITDAGNKGQSKTQPADILDAYTYDSSLGSQVLSFHYALHKGEFQWPYVGLNLETKASQFKAISTVQGLAYRYKGAAHTIIYLTSDIQDYAHYRRAVPESDTWTTILVPFIEFRQPVWGKKAEFDPTHLEGLQWQVQGFEGDTGSLAIDEVRFIRKFPKALTQ